RISGEYLDVRLSLLTTAAGAVAADASSFGDSAPCCVERERLRGREQVWVLGLVARTRSHSERIILVATAPGAADYFDVFPPQSTICNSCEWVEVRNRGKGEGVGTPCSVMMLVAHYSVMGLQDADLGLRSTCTSSVAGSGSSVERPHEHAEKRDSRTAVMALELGSQPSLPSVRRQRSRRLAVATLQKSVTLPHRRCPRSARAWVL